MLFEKQADQMIIRSDRLEVSVAHPGTLYNRTRFDWTGFITQVTLDGEHTFCVPESLEEGKGCGGIGLCNEFGIDTPIGYDEAQPGDLFPKLGIGLLKRDNEEDYKFAYPYEIAQEFPIHVEAFADGIVFMVDPIECNGYAARMVKTLRVKKNELTISYRLENAGSKPLKTMEYCHNFVGFNSQLVGEGYLLTLPFPIKVEKSVDKSEGFFSKMIKKVLYMTGAPQVEGSLTIQGSEMKFEYPGSDSFYIKPLGFQYSDQPQWELSHSSTGLTMREYDDFAPARVAIWGTGHVISTEVFVGIDLQPGESFSWLRRYEFDMNSK